MGQANLFLYHELSSLRRGHAFFTFTLPATRFVRVILDQGAMRSSQGRRRKKKTRICACHPCASHTSVSFKKKNYPSQILTVILAQGPCSNIQSHTIFVQSRAAVSRRRNSVILAQGPCNVVQQKRRRQARSEVRTSGPALEGTIVSPLVNTTSGLSGGRRGGDVSGAAPAPSLVVARLLAQALALDLAC